MKELKQKYFSEPSENGGYNVVCPNEKGELVPLRGEHFQTEEEAKRRAHELNQEHFDAQQG